MRCDPLLLSPQITEQLFERLAPILSRLPNGAAFRANTLNGGAYDVGYRMPDGRNGTLEVDDEIEHALRPLGPTIWSLYLKDGLAWVEDPVMTLLGWQYEQIGENPNPATDASAPNLFGRTPAPELLALLERLRYEAQAMAEGERLVLWVAPDQTEGLSAHERIEISARSERNGREALETLAAGTRRLAGTAMVRLRRHFVLFHASHLDCLLGEEGYTCMAAAVPLKDVPP